MAEPTTLQIAYARPPRAFATFTAASVSAVSPDCEIARQRTRSETSGSRFRNSLASSTSTGIRRERLDHEPAGEARVPRRAARDDDDALERPHVVLRQLEAVEDDVALLEGGPAADRVGDRPGLLEDLLVHEVLVAILLRGHRAPLDLPRLAGDRLAVSPVDRDPARREHRELALLEVDHVARVLEDRGHVRREEALALAEADDERATRSSPPRSRPGASPRRPRSRRCPGPATSAWRTAVAEVLRAALERVGDQVRDDLGVGLRRELVAPCAERRLQREVVLDDPVVDDRDAAVAVRVCVLVGRAPVRRPARVADARACRRPVPREQRDEVRELPLGARAPRGRSGRRPRRPRSRSRGTRASGAHRR